MCLSEVYTVRGSVETLVCEYVSDINIDGSFITLTDVIGQQVTVEGTLLKVDLINNKVMIKAA